MSGLEAVEAIQLIDACIGIVNTIIGIGRAVHDAQGLPPKLKRLFEKIPAIEELLESAHEHFQHGNVAPDASRTAQPVLKQCERALSDLQEVFRKACPKDDDNRGKRLWRGAKTVFFGRDSRVQTLLVQIQDNLRILEQEEIYAIADKLDELQDVTQSLSSEDSGKYVHSGAGNIFANEIGNPTYNVASGSHGRLIVSHGTYVENSSTEFGNLVGGKWLKLTLVHMHNYLPPERPDTPPAPFSTVPFRDDPDYLDRLSLTDHLWRKMSRPTARVALVGLGGVGKTQLAINYAKQLRQHTPSTWVLWIYTTNAARFDQSVRDLAEQLKIRGRREARADHLQLLRNWLQDDKKGQWLVVLDSADDADFLFHAPTTSSGAQTSPKRIECIPICEHGTVLITTRNKKQALSFVYESDVVTVPPMNRDEATRLFEIKLEQADTGIEALADALDGIPLAITQAAAYIRERQPRCSVQQYLLRIKQSHSSRKNPLRQETPLANRDAEAVNSVLWTWHISFEHLYNTRRPAAELLSLMSFCERHDIPKTLMHARTMNDEADRDAEPDFEDAIAALRSFSFVALTAHGESFEMHGLVQQATQIWLAEHERLDVVRHRFIHCLYLAMPPGCFENWTRCRTMYPHAKCAIEQKPVDQQALLQWAAVMYNSAWYAVERGMFTDALVMSQASFDVLAQYLGKAHESTSWSAAMVALARRNIGEWKQAETLELNILDIRRTTLGAEHPNTLTAKSNLASTYGAQGRLAEAEALKAEVLEVRSRSPGSRGETSVALTSMTNLAATYWNQGRHSEAEDLEVHVLSARRAALGPQHPDTIMSLANLASTYWSLERWEEASTLEEEVLSVRREVLGEEHADTLTAMNNLATTYWSLSRCSEAEGLYSKVLETRKRTLGESHPDTLVSMNNLASTLHARPHDAEFLLREVVDKRKQILGATHPGTLGSMGDLAAILERAERWTEAEELLIQVLMGCESGSGMEHAEATRARRALGRLRGSRPREIVVEILAPAGVEEAQEEETTAVRLKSDTESAHRRTGARSRWSAMVKGVRSRIGAP